MILLLVRKHIMLGTTKLSVCADADGGRGGGGNWGSGSGETGRRILRWTAAVRQKKRRRESKAIDWEGRSGSSLFPLWLSLLKLDWRGTVQQSTTGTKRHQTSVAWITSRPLLRRSKTERRRGGVWVEP
ncbi:hypothetical protein IF2G_02683 [Cordyceps javanica]|nr:hypothetical protein IF2G_02683 [Cordyceps javanica]